MVVLATIYVGLLLLTIMYKEEIELMLAKFFKSMKRYPISGSLLFITIFVVATILLFPGKLLTLGAGYAYM